MKVILLNPPFKNECGHFSRTSRSPAITKSGTLYYPFWLSYAAGVLEDDGFDVRLIDACATLSSKEEVLAQIEEFAPKLVIVDTSTPSIYNDVEIAGEIKRSLGDTGVFVVGTHPSALPSEVLGMSERIDGVCLGEYDYTVRDIARCIESKGKMESVPGICIRKDGALITTGTREKIDDLDSLPFVSRVYKDHLNYKDYFFSAAEYPMVMIITGRGCPFKCFYCVYPQTFHGNRYRLRSPANVVDEFEYIVNAFPGIRSIGVEDDTFTAYPKRVAEICRMIIDRRLHHRVTWWANARVNLELDVMKLMKKAGCRLLIPGFESSQQDILDNIRKGTKVNDAFVFMKNANKAGLLVHGCFMVGNPGETKKSMEETLKFAIKLNCDTAQFFPMIPYPGTKAFEWATENSYLRYRSFSDWLTEDGLHNTILNPSELTSGDLVNFCNYARKRYYLRASYLAKKLLQSLSNSAELKRNLKAFKSIYRHLVG
jgi:anaerobic magnesium-protoporphyrin IX monomethyl ester cyclase